MPGFEQVIDNLRKIQASLPELAAEAVAAAQEPIFQASQGLVPVDTGRLKGTGVRLEPVIEGTTATGIISYGSAETITDWHGVGYEILVHTPGTKFYGGVPYLEQPTLDAIGTSAAIMAQIIQKGLS